MSCEDLFHFYADVGNFGLAGFCSYDPNLRANLWQGNSVDIFLHLFAEGVPVDDLSLATSGIFQALGHRDNAIGVQISYPDPNIAIDSPSTGVVKVSLDDTMTNDMEGEYDLSIEFTWADKVLEWQFGKTLNVMRDKILFP
jgi:hypothetical protein